MRRVALLALLALAFAPQPTAAGEITIITYDLSGVYPLSVVELPLYETSAPGPGGFGSRVTFRFAV